MLNQRRNRSIRFAAVLSTAHLCKQNLNCWIMGAVQVQLPLPILPTKVDEFISSNINLV